MNASRRRLSFAVVALALAGLPGCSSDSDSSQSCGAPQTIGVVGAMPSELAPLLERATVDETIVHEGRLFHRGTLGGMPVVLAMTGIGLVNATETTRLLLDRFELDGLVFSGVAGSPHRIADVTVPESWSEPSGESYAVDAGWLEVARTVAARVEGGNDELERCTPYPLDDPAAELVCMPFAPAVFVGGRGSSSDPFGGAAVICRQGGGDVFGCDPTLEAPASVAASGGVADGVANVAPEDDLTVDMETAASAREAAARGLPFLAFRAVSDGAEDPLGLPGFPTQFFAYYRLAAENAAAATTRFLAELAATGQSCD